MVNSLPRGIFETFLFNHGWFYHSTYVCSEADEHVDHASKETADPLWPKPCSGDGEVFATYSESDYV